MQVTRRGTVVRGPDGPSLKPRLLSALSPLEAELVPLLEARAGSSDLACDVAVFRFEPVAKGFRHVRIQFAEPLGAATIKFAPPNVQAWFEGKTQVQRDILAQRILDGLLTIYGYPLVGLQGSPIAAD